MLSFQFVAFIAISTVVAAEYDYKGNHPIGYSFAKFSGGFYSDL